MSNFVTKEQYDREISALKAEIDTLKATVGIIVKSNVLNRVIDLEHERQPLATRGVALPQTSTSGTPPGPLSFPGVC